jgi:hypothetical protein
MFIAHSKPPAGSYFDPNTFDPGIMKKFNSADGNGGGQSGQVTQAAKLGQKMQITVTVQNLGAVQLTAELWYYLNSMIRVKNLTYVSGVYGYIPQNSYEGIKAVAAGTDATVGFNALGECVIRGAGPVPGPATAVMTIRCKEIAYASLFEASAVTPFIVSWFRMQVTTDPQIDEAITHIKKSYSGGISENPINPRAYFDPKQQQPLTVDVLVTYDVGIDRGLRTVILPGENVRYALFVQFWTNQTLAD